MTIVDEKKVEGSQRTAERTIEQVQQTTKDIQQKAEEERARLSKAAEKLVLASIGAVSLGQETLEKWMKRFVERGEQVQEEARKQANALRDKGRRMIRPTMQKVEIALDDADVPSKADLQSLQDQIAALSTKADAVSKADLQSLQNQVAALSAKVDQLSDEKAQRTTQAQSRGV